MQFRIPKVGLTSGKSSTLVDSKLSAKQVYKIWRNNFQALYRVITGSFLAAPCSCAIQRYIVQLLCTSDLILWTLVRCIYIFTVQNGAVKTSHNDMMMLVVSCSARPRDESSHDVTRTQPQHLHHPHPVSESNIHTCVMSTRMWGKPYNAADVDFPNLGEGVPLWFGGRHWWCRTGRQWVATGRLHKAVRYLLRFYGSFEVKFWFPNLGERGPLWGGPFWCQMGRQWLPTDRIIKPLGVCYGYAAVLN